MAHAAARERALKALAELATFPNYFPDVQLWLMVFLGWTALGVSFMIVNRGVLLKRPSVGRAARTVEHVIGALLSIFFVANIYYKVSMGWIYLAYLLYPCHSLSLAWIYVIWSTNHRRAEFVWNLLVFYTQFPLLALLFPDTSDVVFPLQTEVYWMHHILLVCTPLILFYTKRYHIERVSHYWYFVAVLIGVWYCFGVQLLAGILSRVNVNYTLWPPPAFEYDSVLSGPWYHAKMTAILAIFAWLMGYPTIWIAEGVENMLRSRSRSKQA